MSTRNWPPFLLALRLVPYPLFLPRKPPQNSFSSSLSVAEGAGARMNLSSYAVVLGLIWQLKSIILPSPLKCPPKVLRHYYKYPPTLSFTSLLDLFFKSWRLTRSISDQHCVETCYAISTRFLVFLFSAAWMRIPHP